ncbi:MAG: PAS domain S-box protein [Methanomassiliicoccus sp.]|nr:PAS domain S-box protein [Methanomassiliicoccus sp.]
MPVSNDKQETNAQRELRTLRDYVHLLADAIDKSPIPFVAGYPDGRTMAFNEAFTKLSGYTEEELRNMQWVLYLTPAEWQEQEAQAMEELRKTGKPQTYEKEQANKDGSRTPVEVILSQTNDRDGKVQYYYALIKDRSEKQRADRLEQQLQEAGEKAQDINGTAFEGVVIFQDGKVAVANERFAEMTGYELSELKGVEEATLVTPGLRGLIYSQVTEASNGTSEAMLNHKDGRTVAVEVRSREVQYKGAVAREDRVWDVSERARYREDKEQLVKQLASVSEELSGLNQVSTISVNVAQPELAMGALLRNLATITRADGGAVMVRKDDKLVAKTVHGFGDKIAVGQVEDISTLFPGRIITENQGKYVEDAQVDLSVSETLKAAGARSVMGVPIRHSSNIIGVLQVAWNAPHPETEREMRLLEIVADRCASAIMASSISEHTKVSDDLGSVLSEINTELSSTLNLGMSNFR